MNLNSISVEITGNEKAKCATLIMKNFEKIVQHYGIELVGWTYKFVNPSKLLTLLPGLQRLLDAINNGTYKFVKLTPLQLSKHCRALQKNISEGNNPVPKGCKPHKDRGTKITVENESGGSNVKNQQPKPKKRHSAAGKKVQAWPKSREVVVEDSEE